MTRRVVVTGYGVACPWGVGDADFRAGLAAGRVARDMADFDAKVHLGLKGLRSIDRVSRLTLVAAQDALTSAGLAGPDARREDVGVALGSAFSGLDSIMGFFTERLTEGANYVTASNFGNIVMNAAASQVALRFGLPALNATVTSGAASGADAIGWGVDLVRAGRAQVVLAGGVEEISAGSLAVLGARGRLGGSEKAFTPGEGAAFLVLEDASHAAARGAIALAEVAGYGQAFDPGAVLGLPPEPSHAARALVTALGEAGVTADELGLIVLAANGSADLATLEAAALALALGPESVPRLAPKLWLGESLGAAGALGAAVALLALTGAPIAGLGARPRTVLISALDPDGHQAALVLKAVAHEGTP